MVRLQKSQCSQNIDYFSVEAKAQTKELSEAENKKVYNEKYKTVEMKNLFHRS
jgi:hypothetical protein